MSKPLWMLVREAFERKNYFSPPTELRDELVGIATDYAQQQTAAARAEIERLTKERDEARAQVAAALEAAADTLQDVANNWDCGHMESRLCDCARDAEQWGFAADEVRSLTPADAQAALEAYGREKVREGMRLAAECRFGWWLCIGPDGEPDGTYCSVRPDDQNYEFYVCQKAILAEMEKDASQ